MHLVLITVITITIIIMVIIIIIAAAAAAAIIPSVLQGWHGPLASKDGCAADRINDATAHPDRLPFLLLLLLFPYQRLRHAHIR